MTVSVINPKKFRSKLELRVFNDVKPRLGGTAKLYYEQEKLGYTLEKEYTPDFLLEFRDGTKRFIEVKGHFKWEDREKMYAVKKAHPNLDIRMVFDRDNKIAKNSKMRYSDWCAKYGYMCAFGSIPDEWLE